MKNIKNFKKKRNYKIFGNNMTLNEMNLISKAFKYELAVNKVNNLKKLDIEDSNGAIFRMYKGKKFDHDDKAYLELLQKSKELCEEYTKLCGKLYPTEKEKIRKTEILDLLFPAHGTLYGVGAGIQVVAGLVDLGENCYINANVKFSKDVLVKTGNYFICAPNVVFGNGESKKRLGKIEIAGDVWICADVKIASNVKIEQGCVVAFASSIKTRKKLKAFGLYGGSPVKRIKTIEAISADIPLAENNDFLSNLQVIEDYFGERNNEDFSELGKLLKCQNYNSLDPFMGRINDYTHAFCAKYNQMSTEQQRNSLKDLFPVSGCKCAVGSNIYLDTIGTVTLGDNIIIGNNVTLMGNIKIGDNCTIEDNVSIIAIGHDVYYEGRHITIKEGVPYMQNTSGYVIIENGVHIHKGAKIISSQTIKEDINANTLVLGNGKKTTLIK